MSVFQAVRTCGDQVTLEIECDEPEVSICECCGEENLNLYRTIYDGDNAIAVYMVTLPSHAGLPVSILLIMGRLDDDASREERFSMTFEIVNMPDQFGTGVTDPSDCGWDETEVATMLSKQEAKSRFSKEIYAFSDLIVGNDPVVRSYLDASLTHGHSPATLH
jgi:hypothetical protein